MIVARFGCREVVDSFVEAGGEPCHGLTGNLHCQFVLGSNLGEGDRACMIQ